MLKDDILEIDFKDTGIGIPLWASTIDLTIFNPIPLPSFFLFNELSTLENLW